MAKYKYRAKKGLNDIVEGVIDAESKEDALNGVFSRDLYPISVELDKEDAAKRSFLTKKLTGKLKIKFLRKAGPKEVLAFSQKLATLSRAKVELLSSLKIIHDQSEHPGFKGIVLEIYKSVKQGSSFSEALARFPAVFSSLFVSIIKAGEAGGSIDKALEQINQFLTREDNLKRKVGLALAYPALLILVGLGSIFVLMNFVIPRLKPVFEGLGVNLPLPTKIILQASAFSSKGWWLFLLAIAGGIFFLYSQRKSSLVNLWKRKIKSKTPVVKRIVKNQELAHFSRSLGLLLKSGVPALKTLEIAVPTIEDKVLRKELEDVCVRVAQGQSFSQSIENLSSLPPFFVKMVAVGEESGSLADVLEEISSSYTQQVDGDIALVSSLLEPLLILALGLVLGSIVLSILIPIFDLTQMVR